MENGIQPGALDAGNEVSCYAFALMHSQARLFLLSYIILAMRGFSVSEEEINIVQAMAIDD